MGVNLDSYFKVSKSNLKNLSGKDLRSIVTKTYIEQPYASDVNGFFSIYLFSIDTKTSDKKEDYPLIELEKIGEKKLSEALVGIDKSREIFVSLMLAHGAEENAANLKEFIEKAKAIYKLTRPQFGFCGYELGFEPYLWRGANPIQPDFNDCIMWLNFFGPELVKKYGKEKLLSSPAYEVEELLDGGIFIRASFDAGMRFIDKAEEIEGRKLTAEEFDLYDVDAQIEKIKKHLEIKEVKRT